MGKIKLFKEFINEREQGHQYDDVSGELLKPKRGKWLKINPKKYPELAGEFFDLISIAYSSLAVPHSPTTEEQEKAKSLTLVKCGKSNPNQFDLYYLTSVLVSSGWNKNDDVFDIRESWAARKTPEDKQFNYMHDETDIIGHITDNMVVDFEGNRLDSKADWIEAGSPKDFNIITNSIRSVI